MILTDPELSRAILTLTIFPKPHQDVLEQTICYRVPPDKQDELAGFDGSVMSKGTKGDMSARCDREPANILAATQFPTSPNAVDPDRSIMRDETADLRRVRWRHGHRAATLVLVSPLSVFRQSFALVRDAHLRRVRGRRTSGRRFRASAERECAGGVKSADRADAAHEPGAKWSTIFVTVISVTLPTGTVKKLLLKRPGHALEPHP